MTSAIRTGRVAFVGAGPGDPGLLTVRAVETMGTAAVLVTDPDVPAAIIVLAIGAEIRHAVGEPADVAKGLVDGRTAGSRGGAGWWPATCCPPIRWSRRSQAVARSGVAFDVIPGISAATAAAAYAGIPVGSVHTIADVRSTSDWGRLAGAPGTLLLQAAAGHLADTAAALAESGIAAATPASITAFATLPDPAHRGRHPRHPGRRSGASCTGPLVVTVGTGISQRGRAVLVGVPGAVRLAGADPADPGPRRRHGGPAPRARRHPGTGPDHRRGTTTHPGPDGARGQGPGRRPLPVGGLHLDQLGASHLGEVHRVRPGLPGRSPGSRSPAWTQPPVTRCRALGIEPEI